MNMQFSSIIFWKDCIFFYWIAFASLWKSIWLYLCGLFLGYMFCSIGLWIYSFTKIMINWFLWLCKQSWSQVASFLQICTSLLCCLLWVFAFPWNFRHTLAKWLAEVFEVAWNLHIKMRTTGTLTTFSLPVHKLRIALHLIRLSFLFFQSFMVLCLQFLYTVKFTPNYYF